MAEQPKASAWVANAISILIVGGFFVFVALISWGLWKLEDNRFNVVWPQLVALTVAVVGFHLGSSKQAERAQEIAAAPPPPQETITKVLPGAAASPVDRLAEVERHLAGLAPDHPDRPRYEADAAALRQKVAGGS